MRHFLIPLAALLLISACGPKKPQLQPPSVRLVELTLSRPGEAVAQRFEARLRVRNTSETTCTAVRAG